jgi:hypothetical protein
MMMIAMMVTIFIESQDFIDKPVVTFRLDSISALFPARAMTTLGSPLRCSSFTHDLAPLKESY